MFDYILNFYEHRVATYDAVNYNAAGDAPEDHLAINLRAAWAKANNYYQKLDRSPAYHAATLLHLYYKNYCELSWADRPGWLDAANAQFREYNTAPRQARRLQTISDMDNPIDLLTTQATTTITCMGSRGGLALQRDQTPQTTLSNTG